LYLIYVELCEGEISWGFLGKGKKSIDLESVLERKREDCGDMKEK
jgi:hypothetical protein